MLTNAKCTNCGATLTVDEQLDAAICQHCGSAFVVEKAINHYRVSNTINANTVNVYTTAEDFVIRAGVLRKYNGAGTDVTIPDAVKVIGTFAFDDCRCINSIVIPEGVTEIMDSAFANCSSLGSVCLPTTLRRMERPFPDCNALKEIDVPAGVEEIGLMDTRSLESVTLHEGLRAISDAAFTYCINLKEVSIPQSVCRIGQVAFRWCASLQRIVIPTSVREIDARAFQNCSSLEEIVFLGELPEFIIRDERVRDNWEGCVSLTKITACDPSALEQHERSFEGTPWYYRRKNLCVYCGAGFKGLFRKVCARCGRPKDY